MDNSNRTSKASTELDNMGYVPAQETTLPATSNADDVQTIINKAVKEVTVDEKGKYVYPDGMDPTLKAAVAATKSYRDNQSGFTKSQQSLKETEAERDALREQLAKQTVKPLELSTEDQSELDKLYVENPTAWRHKMNMLDKQSTDAVHKELTTVTEASRTKAGAEFELDRRVKYLEEFNDGRKTAITPDILDNDVPNRINSKLADRSVTFEEYLDEVSEYLNSGKVVAKVPDNTTVDLNKANGSAEANKLDKKKDELSYDDTRF